MRGCERFEHRVGHGGELDDGDDGTDGDDQEDGDNVDRDVDATLRSLTGAHSVVAAQLVVPQAVGPGRGIELQGLIGHPLTIALSVNFSRLTKQLCTAQLDTFSLVRMRGFLIIITETARRQRSADGRRHGEHDTAPTPSEVTSSTTRKLPPLAVWENRSRPQATSFVSTIRPGFAADC